MKTKYSKDMAVSYLSFNLALIDFMVTDKKCFTDDGDGLYDGDAHYGSCPVDRVKQN